MSAFVRYQKLRRKVLGLETAGMTGDAEYQRVKAAMREVVPHLSAAEMELLGLAGSQVGESVGEDVNTPMAIEGKTAQVRKDKETSTPDAVSGQEQGDEPPAVCR